ncbi:ABC-type transport system involved in resistance to organic solvents, auxiliary component [Methylophilaceae bacterium 11]|jgi:phospholipid transport system substrate-binding protein|uniref:MlaC/ttg2D family ABC transporter substrate-binding protein n=1 Tax=Methylotenera sp. 1P/1 TaxID=1131551 RepID=UPI00036A2955|nr:ABC transporter substrate-binding protein [Methylotenera sp. 1P/1]EUJ09531.1 ABC-type transport system involved in resistance to organic solvents, auxiliary component [Methylophilaceae bacterium 11]
MKQLIAAFGLLLASSLAIAGEGPDELVKRTADDVLAVVKSDKDIQAGNQDKIFKLAEEKILPNFNFEKVSRLVLGKNWTKATPEQQAAFQNEFKTLLLRTYATALSKYKNQVIEYKPLRLPEGSTSATVKTSIVQQGGQPIAVDYALEKKADDWKVYDIVIEGVSLVTNYRSQFAQEIRQNGLDSLIKKLAEKNGASAAKSS